jgi:hypothetical protein
VVFLAGKPTSQQVELVSQAKKTTSFPGMLPGGISDIAPFVGMDMDEKQ